MTTPKSRVRTGIWLLLWLLLAIGLPFLLGQRIGKIPPLGTLLDPLDGLYRTARQAEHADDLTHLLSALQAPVTVLRDDRGVPHLFAQHDRDAIVALGYVVAQDRLFQLDFTPRAAAGRLSEVFGPDLVEADRYLRRTGMEWGARRSLERLQNQGGVEYEQLVWFAQGVNAYLDTLEEKDLPFEFRLLGYRPQRYSPLQSLRLMQFFAYDLSYSEDALEHAILQERLGSEAYERLYPRHARMAIPIIPQADASAEVNQKSSSINFSGLSIEKGSDQGKRQAEALGLGGFVQGKGSNNWVVAGSRATTGAPIIAGDMHLRLSLPSTWYEVHLVTPTMNTYGVTAPGAPLPVQAFNDFVGWTFTNTGADAIDHYRLELDETGTRYRYEDGYRDLEIVLDTVQVRDRPAIIDTLYYSHWGPVVWKGDQVVSYRWTAYEESHTLQALWDLNHARNASDIRVALAHWDTPMQNVAYADIYGDIGIQTAGHLPIRSGGHGVGLLDGTNASQEWQGRVPFEELPHAHNPGQGFLSSSNQEPADATYPYYLGHDWHEVYRSIRLDTLLRSKRQHSLEDFKKYQSDIHAVQHDLFQPFLDTLTGISPRADTLRQMLSAWDGQTGIEAPEPLILEAFLSSLKSLVWDEPVFQQRHLPHESVLYDLLSQEPDAPWLDRIATEEQEQADDILRLALEATADTLAARVGWQPESWRWGDHHVVYFLHLTQSRALRALWRGPEAFPGFASTVSPGGGRRVMKSASWRVIIDFSSEVPRGLGVYPGGQQGNPFSHNYDRHLSTYLNFDYYDLLKPTRPDALEASRVSSRMLLTPTKP